MNLPENILSLIGQGDFNTLNHGHAIELKPSWQALDDESYALLTSESNTEEIILTVVGISDLPMLALF